MKGLWLAAAAVLLQGCVRRVECVAHGGPVWWQLRTQHFSMLTDLPREQAHQEALDLEELRLAVRFVFQLASDGDDLTQVVYLAEPEELEEFVALAGYARWDEPPESGYVVSTFAPPKSYRKSHTIPHELAHRFSKDAFANAVPWLEEGVASYLESMRIIGPYALWVGDIGDRFGFNGRLRSVEELWPLPPFAELSGAEQQLAYASAWAYVHYLVNHEPARWAAFTELRRRGADSKAAFVEVFPPSEWVALQERVEDYKDKAEFTKQRLEFKYERRILDEAEVPPWQVHLVRWRIAKDWSDGPATEGMKADLEKARGLAPKPFPWPVVEAGSSDPLMLQIAATANPGDYFAQLWLVEQARHGGNFALAESQARRALEIRPQGPTALCELGIALSLQGKVEEGAQLVERAQRMAPGSARLAMGMAVLSTIQHKCDALALWLARARLQAGGDGKGYDQIGNDLLKACAKPGP